jgi:hypothetical protein
MFIKRIGVLVCLCVSMSILLASKWNDDFLRHIMARRVHHTAIVSGGGRRLLSFFDGLQRDPHWDAKGLPRVPGRSADAAPARAAA